MREAAKADHLHVDPLFCRKVSVADLVFLVDGSWSITEKNFKIIQDFLYTLVDNFDTGEDKVQIGLIQYSSQPHNEFFLNTYRRKEDILHSIQNLRYKGGGTKTGESLQFMLDTQFQEMAGSRHNEGIPQIAVVITDGQAQDNIREPAEAVKNAGITLYAIGIKEAVLSELQEIASDPDDMHVYNVADFAALQGISQSILQVLCTTAEEASRQINQVSPVCRKATVADIVFLVDSSSSIEKYFQKVKDFLTVLISSLDVGSDRVRIGLAQYSRKTFKEFLLNQYSLKSDILEHIQNLTLRGGSTHTGAALDFIRTEYFTKSTGSRMQENIPQVLILITDGKSNDEFKVPASKLRARGISVYAVGTGARATDRLQEIASRPSDKFLFNIDSSDLTRTFLQAMCFEVERQIKDSLKQNGDVVFLVGSSDVMKSSTFEEIKTFIAKIVESLDVGVNKYRIGFAQYNEDGQVEFLLKTYENENDVLHHIQGSVQFQGGPLQTGSALRFLRDAYFTEEAGSRLNQGIPQYIVVVTSEKSEDDVTEAAQELKETGINIITVGVLNSDREELHTVATSPWVFQVHDEQSVIQFHKNVKDILAGPAQKEFKDALAAEAPEDCSSASLADIAFLVDESSRVGEENFQLTKAFLLRIVNALVIGPNNVQVALVLYSDEPRLEFTLDAFEDKSEVLNYLKKLPYHGGQPYTGAAIDFLRKEVFTKEAGSRRDQGVQQLAVVITDGYSLDKFIEPAFNLRHSDVTVYAVGIQNISESYLLRQIATHPSRKHVINMKQPDIEWKIKKRLCNEIVEQAFVIPVMTRSLKGGCQQTEEADIYFLIDGSGSIFPKHFRAMKTFMNEMVDMFQVGPNRVRFGVVQYESSPKLEFTISKYEMKAKLKKAIDAIQQLGGGTNTGMALKDMKKRFKEAARNRVPKYLILITDGESEDEVIEPAAELRKEGIEIYAIGVRNASKEQLDQITGKKNQTFLVNEFDSLQRIKLDVVREICSPKACQDSKADIIFLIDTSESMDELQFDLTKDFIIRIINQSDIGADKVQIGVIKYSSETKVEFPLNRHRNKDDLKSAVSAMEQILEGTCTGKALSNTTVYFDQTEGGRPEVKQHLIVVTDGKSNDKVEEPAKRLREKGIIIHAVGIVKAVYSQLKEIAGTPGRVLIEDSYESLPYLEKTILFHICNPEAPVECQRPEVADIIFVVHGLSLQFQSIQLLMKAVVNNSIVGKDYVQFGAVSYNSVPFEHFPLNKFLTKTKIREAIDQMAPLRGQAFTAKALNFARERFGAAYGGRTSSLGIAHFLVLITDKPTAPADKPNLHTAVQALKKERIKIVAIGTEAADTTELKEMVGDEGAWFFAPSFSMLGNLRQNITRVLCDESKPGKLVTLK
ncbi:collagen alpha-4(VI) chain-like [Heteronotia binoei]|uniref:collagen alpha-4(VI) chain-like n=1 Tax=Heteronotia binoei TaxID=13085 RepID=UPI00292E34B6|nr:collagen alpha-4(VI) chain-like [Heteronotia binoei]